MIVLPEPVTESTTVAPLTGLPLTSFAVTVIVEDPLPAANEVGAAETVELVAETPLLPLLPAEWHGVLPESLYVLPATGTNFQA